MIFIGVCGKRTYLRKKEAQAALEKLKGMKEEKFKKGKKMHKNLKTRRRENKKYYCKRCQGWHLTSKK